jgi:hypothetical protein
MTYDCLAWVFAADAYQLKLERQQNKVLRTAGQFKAHTRSLTAECFPMITLQGYAASRSHAET